jgi:sporulation protein YqfC
MKLRDTVADLADSLELPEEAVSDAMRVTLIGRRRAVVEHHRGLLGYDAQSVEVSAAAGRVRILGAELTLHAMDRDTLIVTGRIAAVEYA